MELFEEFRPEVLVCDIAMPGEDGYSLLGRIRALGGAAATSRRSRSRRSPAKRIVGARSTAGFQVHLAKPVDIDRLVGGACRSSGRLGA